MIKLATKSSTIVSFIRCLRYNYHIEDLMKSNSKIKGSFYAPFNDLYISKMELEKFNEKKVAKMVVEQQKMQLNIDKFKKIFNTIQKNIDQFNDFKTISFVMQVGFQMNWKDEQFWHKFIKRGFLLLKIHKQEDQEKSYSYSVCKFMIAINRLSKMDRYTDQEYNILKIDRFKPLFITFILQLFWQNELQNKYTLPKKLVEILKKNQQLIPFSDIHHMLMAKKIIKDPLFMSIADQMQFKLKKQVKTIDAQNNNQTKICPKITQRLFNEYINDLREKYL